MNSLRFFFISLPLLAILATPPAESAVILKTKGKKVLIYLKGRKTKKGAYFQAVDAYGQAKGLIQIQKTGQLKAIGTVKLGKVQKNWLLEPKSKRWARKIQKKAFLKKRKAYRKMLAKKKRQRRLRRRLASAQNHEEYSSDGNKDYYEDNSDPLPTESSDYETPKRDSMQRGRKYPENKWEEVPAYANNRRSKGLLSTAKLTLGFIGAGGLNNLILKPINNTNLSGFGWEGMGFAEMNFKGGFAVSGLLGYKSLQISNPKSLECGRRGPCSLAIQYVKIGGDLKYIFSRSKYFDLWGGINGAFLWPISEPLNNAGLTSNSFGLHGTLGPILGANLKFANLVVPLSMRFSIFNPPTETTYSWSVFLRAGIGLRL